MRAIWKGALAFGMVSIPVRLYSATEDRDVSFHQVHDEDAGRVRYQRMCTVCDQEVAYADLAKGFELPSGETVILTDEDFANLPLPTTKVVELVAFVPADQVDPWRWPAGITWSQIRPAASLTSCSERRWTAPAGWAWPRSRCGARNRWPCCDPGVMCSHCRRWSGPMRCARRSSTCWTGRCP